MIEAIGRDETIQLALGLCRPQGTVSVVGVDDHDFASVVGLTTVHQQVVTHGAMAARLLLALLAASSTGSAVEPAVHVAESSLVVRSSTAPPRSR